MILEDINNSLTIYYAIGNSLIKGSFDEIPREAFYARIVQKLPYISLNGEYKSHEISYTIFLGTYISYENKIQIFNFNHGQPYIFYLYKNNDDIVCNSYEEFVNKILEFKEKHEELNNHIYKTRKRNKYESSLSI